MKTQYQKGKKAELEVAELLTKLSGVKFRRVPLSGAIHQDFPFDLMKIGSQPSIFDGVGIEVKHQKTLKIPTWIKQIKEACEDAGFPFITAKWFIAFKWKGEWYFILNQNYFTHLHKTKSF